MLTTIPFSGFYDTLHDMCVTDAIDSHFQDIERGDGDKTPWGIDLNYAGACEKYAREYASAMSNELGVNFAFESLKSPRFYNFETDRIFCTIAEDEVARMWEMVTREELAEYVKENFTSRDGFASFYDNFIGEGSVWDKPISEWDHNQVGALIDILCQREGLDDEKQNYLVEDFYFDDLPDAALAYSNYLYEQQKAGQDYESLLEYDEWLDQLTQKESVA